MARDVRVQAVFDTSGAIANINAYTRAIGAAITQNNALGASIRAVTADINTQTGAAGRNAIAIANYARQHVAGVQAVVQQYTALANGAAAAAAQIRNAHTQPPPLPPRPTGGGGGGGGGGAGSAYGGLNRGDVFAAMGAIYAAKALASSLIEVSDAWTDVNGRIRIALDSASNFKDVQKELFDIAQRGRVSFEQTADQFSRIQIAGQGIGLTNKHAIELVQIITDAGRASHRTASEIQSFLTQFPQAIGAGKLSGDEFRSILKSFPPLIRVIEDNWKNVNGTYGISRAELQKLSRDQKLYIDDVINAMMRGQDQLRELAEKAPRTFEQSLVQLHNAWMKMVGEMAEKTGFTDRMTESIDKLILVMESPAMKGTIANSLNTIASSFNAVASAIKSVTDGLDWLESKIPTLKNFSTVSNTVGWFKLGAFSVTQMMDAVTGMDAMSLRMRAMAVEAENIQRTGVLPGLALLKDIGNDKALQPWGADTKARAGDFTMTSRPEDKQLELMKKNLAERLALVNDQIKLEEARKSGGERAVIAAQADLDVERAITKDMRDKLPELAKQLETRIRIASTMKSERVGESKGASLRDNLVERIKLSEQQIELENSKETRSATAITAANVQLEIERQITQTMRDKHPLLVEQLEANIRIRETLKTQRELEKLDSPARERLAQLREEIGLKQIEATGNERLIDEAKTRLNIEKLVTAELRKRNPLLAEQLELAERQRAVAERTARDAAAWTTLYERMGNTLVDSLMQAGKEGRSFADGLKDAGKQFAEMLLRAIVLEPLVKSIAGGMGLATSRATGSNPGNMLGLDNMFTGGTSNTGGGLFGGLFGSSGSVASSGGWDTSWASAGMFAFADGGIVSGRTPFKHSGGLGIMGEAGEEAIMPVTRTSSGKLGVSAAGGGQSQPAHLNITFHVAGDINEDTRMRLISDVHRAIDQREPGIIKGAVNTVRTKIQSNPSFTSRR